MECTTHWIAQCDAIGRSRLSNPNLSDPCMLTGEPIVSCYCDFRVTLGIVKALCTEGTGGIMVNEGFRSMILSVYML